MQAIQEPGEAVSPRERILAAARKIFLDGPPEHATMDAVAQQAGMSKKTIYREFKSQVELLGALLIIIGTLSMIRAFLRQGESIATFYWKEIFLVLGSVVLFGLLVRGAGLVPSLILLVLVSAWASEKFQIKSAVLLAILTSVFSALVFVKGLGLPFSIIGPWFGM